jgi:hypothetical protein
MVTMRCASLAVGALAGAAAALGAAAAVDASAVRGVSVLSCALGGSIDGVPDPGAAAVAGADAGFSEVYLESTASGSSTSTGSRVAVMDISVIETGSKSAVRILKGSSGETPQRCASPTVGDGSGGMYADVLDSRNCAFPGA